MFRNRNWFTRNLWKPKNPHSLEHLKYLYNVLSKNQTVSENNRGLLVETLRSIAEILIWGDQNDSSVFDFFLEKNMLSFFLKILKQKCGSYVCVQLLQTLNILFENIRNETSLYYLLSNNHVNSIIVHKFDFSDEEVMAYYISFLKTLSLKLNSHTIHFFYNEHTNDFPLYTEAIKFFNHPESMVRIAVRTLTLNVYKVDDKSMLNFIRNKTAAPYFSNLVWFIGNHVLELDMCIQNDLSRQEQTRLSDLVAEHLDHLHYLNDILCLNIDHLNIVLIEHLLNKLLIPLYVMSLVPMKIISPSSQTDRPVRISTPLSIFLLSQVFLILNEQNLVHALSEIILRQTPDKYEHTVHHSPNIRKTFNDENKSEVTFPVEPLDHSTEITEHELNVSAADLHETENSVQPNRNITDEEKEQRLAQVSSLPATFFDTIISSLFCHEGSDYAALFALCLLHAISTNTGIRRELIDGILMPGKLADANFSYNVVLVSHLIDIISLSCQAGCRIRLITLELTITLLKRLVTIDGKSILLDEHFAIIFGAKEESTSLLRNYYKSEDIFLDMFEDEYYGMKKRPLNVEWLLMDSNVLLKPAGTPMTGVEFTRRLPCSEDERARRAIRVFLLIRELSLSLSSDIETQLPLTDRSTCIPVGTSLDLNNSDLITCKVTSKDSSSNMRRFLAMDNSQLILVEPHPRLLGWGVTKLAGFLQDIEVVGDKEESKCLHVSMHHTNTGSAYSAKFLFDDHIRCMAAKQKLVKGRTKARKKKMIQLARLLDLPITAQPSSYSSLSAKHQSASSLLYGSCYQQPVLKGNSSIVNSVRSFHTHNFEENNVPSGSYALSPANTSPKLPISEQIRLKTLRKKNNTTAATVVDQSEDNFNVHALSINTSMTDHIITNQMPPQDISTCKNQMDIV